MSDNGQVSLRDYIDSRIKNVEDKLDTNSKFIAQHFELNELAIKKAEDSMLIRLEGMNEFRQQLQGERAEYVTKNSLDLMMKPIDECVAQLMKSQSFNAGRVWMIMLGFALVPTILAIVALFVK